MERSHQCRHQPFLMGKGAAAGPTPALGKGWSRPARPSVQPEPAGVRAFQPKAGVPPADFYARPGRHLVHTTIVDALAPVATTNSAPSVYRNCKMGGHCADACPQPKRPLTARRAGGWNEAGGVRRDRGEEDGRPQGSGGTVALYINRQGVLVGAGQPYSSHLSQSR